MRMPDDSGTVNTYEFCDVWRFEGDRAAELNAFVIKTQTAERAKAAGSSR
jgi:hypothetical protein